MDIRKLMDLLENIEKKDSEVEQDKDSEDIEVDTDVDDEVKDIEEDSDDEDSNIKEKFMSTAANLGHGLYSITPVNEMDQIWNNDALINVPLRNLVKDMSKKTNIGWNFSNTDMNNIHKNRSLVLAIYNEKSDELFGFVANGYSGKMEFSPIYSSLNIDDDQDSVLEKLVNLTQKWMDSIPSDGHKRFKPSKKDTSWRKAENALLDFISLNDYVDPNSSKSFWDDVDLSQVDSTIRDTTGDPEEDKLSEIVNDLQTKWIKADSRKDEKLMRELEPKIEVARAEWLRYRNNKKSNVGREKR
jgi:hypothetical protein